MAHSLKIINDATSASAAAANQLASYFSDQCGLRKLPWMPKEMSLLLDKGMSADLITEIIDRTARAPRPSWAYMSAIIGKCHYYGAYDLASFLLLPKRGAYEDGLPY